MDSPSLAEAQAINETAAHRNVGLVIETRPDEINVKELTWLRQLGVTKVQMGAQSLDDRILALNQRGHTVAADPRRRSPCCGPLASRSCCTGCPTCWAPRSRVTGRILPACGRACARMKSRSTRPNCWPATELYTCWQRGEYTPYTTEQLVQLIADIKPSIPEYCRVNRVIRDIPSTHVIEGNRRTSLRQDALAELARRGESCRCMRCREVRGQLVKAEQLILQDLVYPAGYAEEHFLSFVTPEDQIAGYLRLSLPGPSSPATGLADLEGAALVREVHVYGQSLAVGADQAGAAQHSGLGTALLGRAEEIARAAGLPQTGGHCGRWHPWLLCQPRLY